MQHFDVTLKLLLQRSGGGLLQDLLGAPVIQWLPIELPKVQNARIDLLGELANGTLFHMELQSNNDPEMPWRMAEYYLGIYRQHRRFARQFVLYVGSDPMRMQNRLATDTLSFEYQLIDTRTLDGNRLLASPKTSDNVMAVLTNLRDQRGAVKTVLKQIGESDAEERAFYLQALLTPAGLRGLEAHKPPDAAPNKRGTSADLAATGESVVRDSSKEAIEKGARKMPILNDILDNKVLGREFKRGLEEGRQEGLQEGQVTVLRQQLERRFGVLPTWADAALAKRSPSELQALAIRLLDPCSLKELLG